MLSVLEKVKLSRESIHLVAQLKGGTLTPLQKVKTSRRVNEITVLLGGVITTAETEPEKNIPGDDGLSDVTTSDNYRWKDTAVIAGARKFLTQTFDQAKKEGRNIVISDIDWDELNKDDRLAQALINKKNVFGVVDWNQLRNDGMPSEVAYLIKRVYDAVAKEPVVPTNAESRKNYVLAISNLRDRLEVCRTYEQVKNIIVDISHEIENPKGLVRYYDKSVFATLMNFDKWETRVISELGQKFYSWIFNTANSALQEARTGRVPRTYQQSKGLEWAWLDKEPKLTDDEGKPKKPKAPSFQLEAAADIERIGGPAVQVRSSKELEQMFNFRGIQSGNWVLKDKSSAEFHMQATAEAMLDMSDVLGIDAKHLGLNGNLALAFGARGKKGSLAHYEPSAKVINITKMKGGGSLGHEYFHALDNLINDLATQKVGAVGFFGTRDYAKIEDKELSDAFKQLTHALRFRSNRLVYKNTYVDLNETPHENTLDNYTSKAQTFAKEIGLDSQAPFEQPLNVIIEKFKEWFEAAKVNSRLSVHYLAQRKLGEYLIARHFHKGDVSVTADGSVQIDIEGFESPSDFYNKALNLDQGKAGKYWSQELEMAARSFSAYLQDRLAAMGRKNDYLAYSTQGGNNRIGEVAYPQGVEREAVNAAFDHLFKVIKDKKILETAAQNQAFMDALFSNSFNDPDYEMIISPSEHKPIFDGIGGTPSYYAEDDVYDAFSRSFGKALQRSRPISLEDLKEKGTLLPGVNDLLAQAAATSPLNEGQEPTEQQLQDNDYTTGKFKINELHVHIENPAGSVRSGVGADGETWETKMLAHYGFFADTMGHDGDEVDVFVVPGTETDYSGPVFVVHQNDENGDFDEHKVIIGAKSKAEAALLYQSHYDENWSGMGHIEEYSFNDFVQFLNQITEENKLLKGIYDSWAQDGHYEHVMISKVNTAKAPKLQESKLSIQDPIVVLEDGNKYYLIHGLDRLTLAKERKERMVPAIIFNSDAVTWDMIKAAIRLAGHPVDPVALGALITKLSEDEAMKQL
ncbi:LPD1 domain-containing protein [Acinetobacter baumannii]|uniref:LPD1 domain-containing protein n=1 Tax=Acinetobacter baumannii TaxID=470 RepID=UPI003EE0A179